MLYSYNLSLPPQDWTKPFHEKLKVGTRLVGRQCVRCENISGRDPTFQASLPGGDTPLVMEMQEAGAMKTTIIIISLAG